MADLTPLTRIVFAQIIEDQRLKGYAYRSQGNMAKKLGCCVRSVVNSVNTLRGDGTVHVEARYRTRGRGRSASRIRVDFSHPRFAGCRERALPASPTTQTSCANVLSANSAEDSLRRTVKPECQSHRSLEVEARRTDPEKTPPLKVELAEGSMPPAGEVQAFGLGLEDRCHVRLEPGILLWLVWALTALKWNKLVFLKWVEANHRPVAFHSPERGWRHIMRIYRDLGPVYDAEWKQ